MRKVLIIEDNLEQLSGIERVLRAASFETEYATCGEEGLEKILQGKKYDLLVLDVQLPTISGFDICRAVRSRNDALPILFITGCGDEEHKLNGFAAGGDDYLTKPFLERELVARAGALLRRSALVAELKKQAATLVFGKLEIDLEARTASCEGRPLELTTLEFDLLVFLARSPGRVFSRDELTESLWGYQCSHFGPSITAYFSRLRAKIEPDPKNPRYVHTVRGVGYKFIDSEAGRS